MKKHLETVINSIFNIVYPRLCAGCDMPLLKNENIICTSCLISLPYTNFHTYKNNPVHKIFWGRIEVEDAMSLFYFEKGSKIQKILHNLKYRGQKEIGFFLGQLLGERLISSPFFKELDYIVYVPLTQKKFYIRGFNQSEEIAKGVSSVLNVNVIDIIEKRINTQTQTKKSRIERWLNVTEVFSFKKNIDLSKYYNKHFLIIDDVVTTGSTLEALGSLLLTLKNVKISIATIAKA